MNEELFERAIVALAQLGYVEEINNLKFLKKRYERYKAQNFVYQTQQPTVVNVFYDQKKK